MEQEEKNKKKAKKVLENQGSFPLAQLDVTMELSEKMEELIEVIKSQPKPSDTVKMEGVEMIKLKGDPGEDGHTPTEEELLALIEPLIPEPIPGKDYILTNKDKLEIAKSIKVPVVEKVIEKTETIIEKPTVTEIVKEVAKYEDAEQIVEKLSSLTDDARISIDSIKGTEIFALKDDLSRLANALSQTPRGFVGNGGIEVLDSNNNKIGSGTALKFIGVPVTNTDGHITTIDISGTGGASTLADVSTFSTDATKSRYTMTSGVDVEFETSDTTSLLKLRETDKVVDIGTILNIPTTTSTAGIITQNDEIFIHTYSPSPTNRNLFIGTNTGNFTMTSTTARNLAIGDYSMAFLTTGNNNTAFGNTSLYSITSGTQNVGIGSQTLATNATGSNNVAIGYGALTGDFVSGNLSDNVAIGATALTQATTGSQNTAVGTATLGYNQTGSQNTTLGHQAGLGVVSNSHSNNTFLGYRSGFAITTGSNNIAIGHTSGDNITTGSNNILIGYDIDAQSATGSSQLSIGNLIFATGGFGTGTTVGTGNVGIRNSSPAYPLDIYNGGAGTAIGFAIRQQTGPSNMLQFSAQQINLLRLNNSTVSLTLSTSLASGSWGSGGGNIILSPNNVDTLTATTGGNVGIGTTTPARKLHIFTSSSGVSSVTGTSLILESASTDYISFLAPNSTVTKGIVFGVAGVSTNRAGFFYDHVAGGGSYRWVLSETTRMTLSNAGLLSITGVHSATATIQAFGSSYDSSLSTAFYAGTSGLGLSGTSVGRAFLDQRNLSASTGGTYNSIQVNPTFATTSGTTVLNGFNFSMTIDQSLGGTGITRAIYINPTLTSAADFRAIEITNNSGFGLYQSGSSAINYFNAFTGFGTTSPDYRLHISGTSVATAGVRFDRISTDTFSSTLDFRKARGTAGSETVVTQGDITARIQSSAYNGSSYTSMGNFSIFASAVSGSNIGGGASIATTTLAGSLTTAMSINHDQKMGLKTTPTDASGRLTLGGTVTSANRGNLGAFLTINNGAGAEATDTASSGTVSLANTAAIFGTTFSASSATTYTNANTVYIAGAPVAGTNVTFTNSWALYVNAGNSNFGGGVRLESYLQSTVSAGNNFTIYDGGANELLLLNRVASAVNEITIANAATGNDPTISATGSDSNVGLSLSAKGTGVVTSLSDFVGSGNIDAVSYSVGGVAGFTGTGSYTNFTIVNGIITNAS